jgi:hypothetical protein
MAVKTPSSPTPAVHSFLPFRRTSNVRIGWCHISRRSRQTSNQVSSSTDSAYIG